MGNNYKALLQKFQAQQIEAIDAEKAFEYTKKLAKDTSLDPVMAHFDPSCHLGAVSEKFLNTLEVLNSGLRITSALLMMKLLGVHQQEPRRLLGEEEIQG